MFEKRNNTSTVRVLNIDHSIAVDVLRNVVETALSTSIIALSLALSSSKHELIQTTTITFKHESDAKRALQLSNIVVGACNIAIDVDFLGLTTIATPQKPKIE